MHVYIYIYTHTYTHMYVYSFARTLEHCATNGAPLHHVRVRTVLNVKGCVCIHIYIYIYTHICLHVLSIMISSIVISIITCYD